MLNDIPDYWSPDQALAIFDFLNDLQQRIWNHYQLQIIEVLQHDLGEANTNQLDLFEFNDEIPF